MKENRFLQLVWFGLLVTVMLACTLLGNVPTPLAPSGSQLLETPTVQATTTFTATATASETPTTRATTTFTATATASETPTMRATTTFTATVI